MQGIAKSAFLAMTARGGPPWPWADQRPPAAAVGNRGRAAQHLHVKVENDVFNRFSPTDRDYNSGVRLGWLSPAIIDCPSWVALTTVPTLWARGRRIRWSGASAVVGQDLYTPDNTSQPIYNDRPYAAWLYASFPCNTPTSHDPKTGPTAGAARYAELDLGVIGPPRRRVRAEQLPRVDRSPRPMAGPTSSITSRF
jgi:hypothetical protein